MEDRRFRCMLEEVLLDPVCEREKIEGDWETTIGSIEMSRKLNSLKEVSHLKNIGIYLNPGSMLGLSEGSPGDVLRSS